MFIPCKGQGLEEDNMVLYAKANILYEQGRYDEAVRMYNQILSKDENHTKALFMRAKAKYELGAYKGTKNDALLFIDKAGITKDLIALMAKTEFQLSNYIAARNYARTFLELDPYDGTVNLLAGDIAMENGNRNEACEYFVKAAQLGNLRSEDRIRSYCDQGFTRNEPNRDRVEVVMSDQETSDDAKVDDDSSQQSEGGIVSLEDIVREAEESDPAPTSPTTAVDPSVVNDVVIDDKLTISITDGLGHREVLDQPRIFMLSDQDGQVVIDVCLDSQGTVSEASFNREQSTIFRSSLTSLALRKAKEFRFSSSRAFEQCGVMIYQIKS